MTFPGFPPGMEGQFAVLQMAQQAMQLTIGAQQLAQEVLAEHAGEGQSLAWLSGVMADDTDMLGSFRGAEPEARRDWLIGAAEQAAIIGLDMAVLSPDDTREVPPWLTIAVDLAAFARDEHAEGTTLGTDSPAVPPRSKTGTFASSWAFDRDDEDEVLRAGLILVIACAQAILADASLRDKLTEHITRDRETDAPPLRVDLDPQQSAAPGPAPEQSEEDPRILMTVLYPDPDLAGQQPCDTCAGAGVLRDQYVISSVGNDKGLVCFLFCNDCLGCGRSAHEQCQPGSHPADSDDVRDPWGDNEEEHRSKPPCPSCGGRRFWTSQAFNEHEVVVVRMPCGCTENSLVDYIPA